jgi:hypothetical protein
MGQGDYIRALVDADLVIALRRNWPKGHLRRARALLALGQPHDAKKAIVLGLAFEPQNAVSCLVAGPAFNPGKHAQCSFLQELMPLSVEVDAAIAKLDEKSEKSESV